MQVKIRVAQKACWKWRYRDFRRTRQSKISKIEKSVHVFDFTVENACRNFMQLTRYKFDLNRRFSISRFRTREYRSGISFVPNEFWYFGRIALGQFPWDPVFSISLFVFPPYFSFSLPINFYTSLSFIF